MYESYFGFKDTPFRLSADEKFRYAHKNYLRASAYLAYALQQGEGLVMITGQPGSGKTTLIRDVISELDAALYHTLNLVTSQLHAEELLRKVALELGLPAETYNKATLLTNIQKNLTAVHMQGKRSILFLDEAQNLTPNGLEELRLLSNLQQGKHSLLQIVLVGHQDLRRMLLGPNMEHIQQRLIAICQLEPMTPEQTREYIVHRLQLVDWQNDPAIHDEVFWLIHLVSQGVPRNVNHLMSQLLLFASIEEKHELSDEDALVIIEELLDQQRITLPGKNSFDAFVNQYRVETKPLHMHQAVGDNANISSHADGRKPQNHQPQEDPAPGTGSVGDDSPSAMDHPGGGKVVKLEAPVSDWFLWNHNQTEKRDHEATGTEEREESAASTGEQSSAGVPIDDAADQERRSGAVPPNADEIWQGTSKSMEGEFGYGEDRSKDGIQGGDSEKRDSTILPVGGQLLRDREHRWGGVWFMSSDNSTAQTDWDQHTAVSPNRATGSATSVLKSSHNITVDENLSMPSVWIDSCPEVIVHRDDAPQRLQRKPDRGKGLERSVKHVILWVAIGMLAMLTLRLFPNLYDDFWHDTNARLYAEAGDQQDITPLIPGEKQAIQPPQTVPADLAGAEFMEETPQRADSGLSETAVEATAGDHSVVRQLEIGSSDISSFEHIRLATRYMIHFDFNKSSIPEQYQPLLNSIRNKMLLEENSFLKITGYADSQGDRNYNYRLSLKRADAVRKFFTMRGIGETRLQVAAVGSVGKPEPWLDSIDTRREIRRVEVILFPK